MTGKEYKEQAMVTANHEATSFLKDMLGNGGGADIGKAFNAALGLSGEVGEFNDMLKKCVFHGKKMDEEHLKKELGDICWYIALACDAFGWDMDEIMQMNIDKLTARYHGGTFDKDYANNKAAGDV